MGVPGRKPSASLAKVTSSALVRTGDAQALPEPPELLTPAGTAVWNALLPDLVDLGMFQQSDGLMLVELCETLANAQTFRREQVKLQARLEAADEAGDDELAEMLSARLKRSRAGYLQSMKLCMSIAGEFGASPVSRLRLGLMAVKGQTLLGAMGLEDGDEDA